MEIREGRPRKPVMVTRGIDMPPLPITVLIVQRCLGAGATSSGAEG